MTGIPEFKSANSATVPDVALDCLFPTQSTDYIHVIVPPPSLESLHLTILILMAARPDLFRGSLKY